MNCENALELMNRELDEALTAVQSIIHKCEAARKKFPRGTGKHGGSCTSWTRCCRKASWSRLRRCTTA